MPIAVAWRKNKSWNVLKLHVTTWPNTEFWFGTKYIEIVEIQKFRFNDSHKMLDRRLKAALLILLGCLGFLGFGWFPRVGAHGLTFTSSFCGNTPKPQSHQATKRTSKDLQVIIGYLRYSAHIMLTFHYIPLHSYINHLFQNGWIEESWLGLVLKASPKARPTAAV